MEGDNDDTVGDVVKQRGAKTPVPVCNRKGANSDIDGTENRTCQAEQMREERRDDV